MMLDTVYHCLREGEACLWFSIGFTPYWQYFSHITTGSVGSFVQFSINAFYELL